MKKTLLFVFLIGFGDVFAQRIHRLAGDSAAGFAGDGGQAINSLLDLPCSVASDSIGNILIADAGNNRIRIIEKATGIIKTIAGGGANIPGNGDSATLISLDAPNAVLADKMGNIYFAESSRCVIRRIDKATGLVNIIAGTFGSAGFSGDGLQALSAQLTFPSGICLDEPGNLLYISDAGNYRIRKVDLATNIISTVAGTGVQGMTGDGGLAVNAQIGWVSGITVDSAGNIFFSDPQGRIRTIDVNSGIITTFAGTSPGFSGDGGPALSAALSEAIALCFDKEFANLYFADYGNGVIRKIEMSSSLIETIAGGATSGWVGNGGPATWATLDGPAGVCVTRTHDVIIADTYHNQVRKIYGDQTGYYHQFPDSNAIWNIHNNRFCTLGQNDYYYSVIMSGDTVINSKVYHQLAVFYVSPGTCASSLGGYQGSVREDTSDRKVFFIPPGSSTEELLYDFNMQVGDTVRGYLTPYVSTSYRDYVHSIDSVLVGNFYRKRWHLNNSYQIDLIEGVGLTYGLVVQSPGELGDGHFWYLDCFQQDGQSLYPATSSNCQLINSVVAASKQLAISVVPNPAHDVLMVSAVVGELKIRNLLGTVVLRTRAAGKTTAIDISALASGVYILETGGQRVKFVKD